MQQTIIKQISYREVDIRISYGLDQFSLEDRLSVTVNAVEVIDDTGLGVLKPGLPRLTKDLDLNGKLRKMEIYVWGNLRLRFQVFIDGECVYGQSPARALLVFEKGLYAAIFFVLNWFPMNLTEGLLPGFLGRLFRLVRSRFASRSDPNSSSSIKDVLFDKVDDHELDFSKKDNVIQHSFSSGDRSFIFSTWIRKGFFEAKGGYKLEIDGIPVAFSRILRENMSSEPILLFEQDNLGKSEEFKVFSKEPALRSYKCTLNDADVWDYEQNFETFVDDQQRPRMGSIEYYLRSFFAYFPFFLFFLLRDPSIYLQIMLIVFAIAGVPYFLTQISSKSTGHMRYARLGLYLNFEDVNLYMRKHPFRWYFGSVMFAFVEVALERYVF